MSFPAGDGAGTAPRKRVGVGVTEADTAGVSSGESGSPHTLSAVARVAVAKKNVNRLAMAMANHYSKTV